MDEIKFIWQFPFLKIVNLKNTIWWNTGINHKSGDIFCRVGNTSYRVGWIELKSFPQTTALGYLLPVMVSHSNRYPWTSASDLHTQHIQLPRYLFPFPYQEYGEGYHLWEQEIVHPRSLCISGASVSRSDLMQ
ncbi:hypothetical protein I7I48_05392 [Histoplasma ohiense]|nr:hypothetical protein I7I48_05392 [Histoplasma ohiense (nom. inval.)]